MKSFLVIYRDKQADVSNDALIENHVNYLKTLYYEGNLLTCGPFTDGASAMLVFRGDSYEQVKNWVENDPFIQEKFCLRYEIMEYNEANRVHDWPVKQPQMITMLFRKLKEGHSYEEFRESWLPPIPDPHDKEQLKHYFSGPVKVLTALNAQEPSEIISIALVNGTQQEIMAEAARVAETETIRRERVAKVTDKMADPKMYHIMDIDILGS